MRLAKLASNTPSQKAKPKKKNRISYEKVERWFEGILRTAITKRYLVSGIFGSIIVFSLFMLGVMNKFILFPAEETEIYLAYYEAPNGSTVEHSDELAGRLAEDIQKALGDIVDPLKHAVDFTIVMCFAEFQLC